ncbi:DUF222 domain-containing protein [Microbacterium sp. ZW T5_56]|uniref:HNH endonuclease signature motif containing protein n=1 Tax=Microbacterium sp. ZW T5_56 TaxID=3378081 RepID=UPI003852AACF
MTLELLEDVATDVHRPDHDGSSGTRTDPKHARSSRKRVPPDEADVQVKRAYVEAVVAVTRSRAATDALEAALLADLVTLSGASGASSHSDLELRSLAAEVGAAIHVSDRTIQRRMSDAYGLVNDFPDVHRALAEGEITAAQARVVVDVGAPIEVGDARDRYVARALPLARVQSPNRLRGMLARIAEEVREVGITERHQSACEARVVWVTDDPDGMSTLHAYLPSVLAHGVKSRLDQMAHELRDTRGKQARGDGTPATAAGAGGGAGADAIDTADTTDAVDERTVDQIRADLLADLLLTATPASENTALGSIRATIAVTIPVLTLAGRSDDGAELDGAIPIDADTARILAGGEPGFDRVLTHPITGAVLATDRYRPTAEMKRFLTHRDQHCRHPGCRVPIRNTDIDHNEEWADGGKTDIANLAPLCRRHHTLKTSAGWKITPYPDGVLEFITALKYHHTEIPEPRSVAFVASTLPESDDAADTSDRTNNDRTDNDRQRNATDDGVPPW